MAKFAKVGYGSDGRGIGKTGGENPQGYTYVVNDNVRAGNIIQPVATNWRSGKKFATTGVVLHAYKENSVKGQDAKRDVSNRIKGDYTQLIQDLNPRYGEKRVQASVERYLTQERLDKLTQNKITRAYTGKELNAGGSKVAPAVPMGSKPAQSQYVQETRAGNLAMQMQKNPNTKLTPNAQQTFDEYSKKFMN